MQLHRVAEALRANYLGSAEARLPALQTDALASVSGDSGLSRAPDDFFTMTERVPMVRTYCSLLFALLLLWGVGPAAASPYAWGGNHTGKLGDETTTDRATPVPVSGLSGVVAISGGGNHSLSLLPDGSVRAWGYNYYGQLGDGSTASRSAPVPVSGLSDVVAIAGGGGHSLALLADGTVRAWGDNGYGQLGDGTWYDRATPVPVDNLSQVASIAGGWSHSLALLTDGTVHAWGSNAAGELGDGGTTNQTRSFPVRGLSGVVAIAGGGEHSLALLTDGTVRAWGWNNSGQLGDGTSTNRSTPVPVSGLSGVVAIAGGGHHSLALLADGTVWAWGDNEYGQLGDGTGYNARATPAPVSGLSGVVAIAGGMYHSLALLADGSVRAWGMNGVGQLGDGTTTNRLTPAPVSGLGGVVAIAGGAYHSLAIVGEDDVYGALEIGAAPYRHTVTTSDATTAADDPTLSCVKQRPSNTVWYRIQPESAGMLTITTAGSSYETVVAVFTGARGALTQQVCNNAAAEDGYSAAVVLPVKAGMLYFIEVGSAAPGGGSLVLTASFSPTVTPVILFGWGENGWGQLGDGSTANRSTPVLVSGLSGVGDIAGGMNHSLALLTDGSVRAWGWNTFGQLGDETTSDRFTPVPVSGLSGVVAIAAGYDHNLALLADGTVRAWGRNYSGQLGNGTTTYLDEPTPSPVPVDGLSGVAAIAGGGSQSLALLADGTVRAWGNNSSGQLGDGTTSDRLTPVPVSGLSGVVAIAAGYDHSLALLADGTVRAWGNNSSGQLGDGTTSDRLTPVPVSGLSGVVAIAAGYDHSLALLADGTVRAWGGNSYGQLGDGTTTNRTTPVPVSNLSGVMAITGDYIHSLAILADGTVRAWGYNHNGELGDGTTINRTTPVPVDGLSGVVTIAAGGTHNLALVAKLSLRTSGMGSGIVTSTPAGLTCRGTCTLEPPPGSGVILTATPDPGSVFTGWSGACTGTAHCILDLAGPQAVQAMFSPAPLPHIHLGVEPGEILGGDTLTVTATVTPGATLQVADLYVALELPEASLLFLTPTGEFSPAPHVFAAGWPIWAATGPVLTHPFAGTEPAGTYRWLAALMAPGSLTPLTGITETTVSVWPAPDPALRIYLNSQSLRPGAPLTVGLSLDAPPGPLDRDVYVALQFPDGSLRFLDEAGQVTPTATPYLRHWTGAALVRKAFAYTFTGGESVGTYRWLAAFAEPGTLNFVGRIVEAPFSFAP